MGYIWILRPVNCVIAFISVCVGAWIGTSIFTSYPLLLAGFTGFTVCAFGNVVNDLADIEIDRINNPKRPLPKGTVHKNAVIFEAFFLFVLATFCAMYLGFMPMVLVLGALIVLLVYAVFIKKTIIGNLIVALVSGLSFVLGGIVHQNALCVIPFLFALLVHASREIIKDIIDMEGDRQHGVTSLPVLVGTDKAAVISALLLGILCIALPLPYIIHTVTVRYIIVLLVFAYPLLIYVLVALLKKPQREKLQRYSTILKISMAVGLVAMIV